MSVSAWVFMCVHPSGDVYVYLTAYPCTSFLWLCMSVCVLALCMPVRLWIASGCEKGQSRGWQPTEGAVSGGKYCRGVKLHAGKAEWRAGAVRCFSFCLAVFLCPPLLPSLILSPHLRLFQRVTLRVSDQQRALPLPFCLFFPEVIAHEEFLTSEKGDLIIHRNPNLLEYF